MRTSGSPGRAHWGGTQDPVDPSDQFSGGTMPRTLNRRALLAAAASLPVLAGVAGCSGVALSPADARDGA